MSQHGSQLPAVKNTLLTYHTSPAAGRSHRGSSHTCPPRCCSGNSHRQHSLLWDPQPPSSESGKGTKRDGPQTRMKVVPKSRHCFYISREGHKTGRHLRCWVPGGRAVGSQGLSYVHLQINTQHCFLCKTPDKDDKCHHPWQSPQTEAYTSHSAYPGNGGGIINHQWTWKNSVYSRDICFTRSTYYGVIVALKANIWFADPSAVAVFVAATLRGAVIPNKSKVTLANSWGNACPVHTALCTHWLTLTRNTVTENNQEKILVNIYKSNTVTFGIYILCLCIKCLSHNG